MNIHKLDSNYLQSPSASLVEFYLRVRQDSLLICEPLALDDYGIQSMLDVSPPKWHLAHTSWFFETFVLKPHVPNYCVFHAKFAYIFNSYYNQIGQFHARSQRGFLSRPTLKEVLKYRAYIDQHMLEFLDYYVSDAESTQFIDEKIMLGLHHEQQHQELLYTDIKHIMAVNPLKPSYQELPQHKVDEVAEIQWVTFSESLSMMGVDNSEFCYDNEMPAHKTFIGDFAIASRLVTNAEYLEFMQDGAYQTPHYWLSDGWQMINDQQWEHPLYWETNGSAWLEMTLSGLRSLDLHAPVSHVSYYEAAAYANWCDKRLPTEAEWEKAVKTCQIPANVKSVNLRNAGYYQPIAVSTDTDSSINQMYGDVWEWTQSPYISYPGFHASKTAIGEYNGKFMNNQMVLRGGSCVTANDHIRATYRNFFYPADRWQFSGIRLAKDNNLR